MSRHVEGAFTGVAGGRIFWRGWIPDSPVGVVVISHGVAEHSGRYEHVGNRLADNGFATYAFDHRGHGKSEGNRSNIDRMSSVVADLGTMIGVADENYPSLPVFLLGHSMGSLISLQYVTGSPADLRGLIVSAPAVDIAVGNVVLRTVAPILSNILPNLGALQLDSSMVSRDPEVVRNYDSDPLNFRGKLPARTGAEIMTTAQAIKERLPRLKIPVLILQGTADALISPNGAQIVADNAASKDLTLKLYDGLYHEVFNEPEKETVLDDVVAWLKAHI